MVVPSQKFFQYAKVHSFKKYTDPILTLINFLLKFKNVAQQTFTCLKSAMETLKKGVKYVQS